MRRFGILGIFTILACVAPSARADVSYQYVSDVNAVSLGTGQTATFNIYIEEHTDTTKGQQSVFNLTGGGLFSGSWLVTRTAGDGGVTFANSGKDLSNNTVSPVWTGTFTSTSIATGGTNPKTGNANGAIVGGGAVNPYLFNSAKSTATDEYRDVLIGSMTVTALNVSTSFNIGQKNTLNSSTLTYTGPGGDISKRVGLDTDNGGSSPGTGLFTFLGARDFTFTINVTTGGGGGVPEPSSMALCGLAACSMGIGAWRRRKAKLAAEAAAAEAASAEVV